MSDSPRAHSQDILVEPFPTNPTTSGWRVEVSKCFRRDRFNMDTMYQSRLKSYTLALLCHRRIHSDLHLTTVDYQMCRLGSY
jgi:hypothetical protein